MKKQKGIYQRGNIYWIRYADADGRLIRESSDSDSKQVAERLYYQRKNEVAEGKHPNLKIGKYRFGELADKYIQYISFQKSARDKTYYINSDLKPRFEHVLLHNFKIDTVEGLRNALLQRELAPASINKVMRIFKNMFTKAVEWEMTTDEILRKVRKVKGFKEGGRLRFLSIEEAKNLLSVCDKHLYPIVLTALHTGMRKTEILQLKWDQVDLAHNVILLKWDETKTDEARQVPINSAVREMLMKQPRFIDSGYVFAHPESHKPYGDIKHSFKAALKRAGIRNFHFHDLRHTFASHLIMAGRSLREVADLLGHKDIKMTMKYAHLAPAHLQGANIMDQLMDGARQNEAKINKSEINHANHGSQQ